jgi:CubicO group peptidase (beta-lactamase class C family)
MRSRPTLLSAVVVGSMIAAACSGDDISTNPDARSPSTVPVSAAPPESDLTASTPPDTTPPESTLAETAPPTEPPETTPARAYDFSAIQPIVTDFVVSRGLAGASLIVVERDDGVVHEEYWGEFDADRVSLIASSSKMISAGVLLHLDDEGILDIDAPVADVAEWGAANPTITPAQLISNSSGLVGLLPDPTYAPYLCQYIATGTLQDCAEQIFTTPDDDADVIAPDSDFRYGGAQWTVAGAVAEVASGKSWAELVDETFAEPCGLTSLAFNNHFAQIGSGFDYPVEFNGDPSTLMATDNPNPEGGAYVSVPDYGQLMLMHLRGGMCDETRVLSSEAVDRMHTDRIGPAYGGEASADGSGGSGNGYGMGWWVDRTTGRINDGGAYGTVPWLDLEDGYGVYLLVESSAGTGAELAALLFDPIEAAIGG